MNLTQPLMICLARTGSWAASSSSLQLLHGHLSSSFRWCTSNLVFHVIDNQIELVMLQQTAALERYRAPFSLTTLICLMGTLQAIVVTFVMEHKLSVWSIGFDMNLLAAAYAVSLFPSPPYLCVHNLGLRIKDIFVVQGIVTSSIAYHVQGLVIQDKGPVFASAFSPLMMIIVAIMGSFILTEKIYLGGWDH